MKINMNIINCELPQDLIVKSLIKKYFSFYLEAPALLSPKRKIKKNRVYVVKGCNINDDFQEFTYISDCSIISIGELPDFFYNHYNEIIILKDSVEFTELFTIIQDIFEEYTVWDENLQNALQSNSCWKEIGRIIYQKFKNPVCLLNIGNKYLFNIYDTENPENKDYYETIIEDPEYPPLDEMQIIYSMDSVMESFKNKEPSIFPQGIYKYRYMYMNIMENGFYAGRLMIGEIYCKLDILDYTMAAYTASAIRSRVIESNSNVEVNSAKFLDMLNKMLFEDSVYKKEYNQLLSERSWKQNDRYVCMELISGNPFQRSSQLICHGIQLHRVLPESYPIIKKGRIILIVNLTRSLSNKIGLLNKLRMFIDVNRYGIGFSGYFSDFAQLQLAYHQAEAAVDLKNPGSGECFDFEEVILDYIIYSCLQAYPQDFYIMQSFKQLIAYDEKHDSQLCKTLKLYLRNNMNVTQTQNSLYIHRSTLNYRIGKIEDILGMKLSDYKTRLYLMMIFELI